jgi:cephalosporin hydroxylase
MRHVGWRTVAGDLKRAGRWWFAPDGRRAHDERLRICATDEDYYAFSSHLGEGAAQIKQEILPFIDIVRGLEPRWVCEIGTSFGGTTFMLSKMLPRDTQLIGIDLFVRNRIQLRHFARPRRIHLLDGASAEPRTINRVKGLLGSEKLDVLFIDGDHTYQGVSSDFLAYRALVRDGGLIAFHDIQPDGRAEGRVTEAWVGEVPEFWQRVKPLYQNRELIGSPAQLGCGIGVLWNTPDAELPNDLAVVP